MVDAPRRFHARLEILEKVSAIILPRGQLMHLHGRFADDAERAFRAGDELVQIGARGGSREVFRLPEAFGRGELCVHQPFFRLAVAVRLLARAARRDPAAQRRELEALRIMAERHAMVLKLFFQRGPVDARLDARGHRHLVDADDARHHRHVHGQHRAVERFRQRVDAAHHGRAAAEGHQRNVFFLRELHHRHHFIGRAGINDAVRRHVELARAHVKQVVIGLAARMEGAFVIVHAQLVLAHDGGELFLLGLGQPRRGEADFIHMQGRRLRQMAQPQRLADPFPLRRLVRQRVLLGNRAPAVPAQRCAVDGHFRFLLVSRPSASARRAISRSAPAAVRAPRHPHPATRVCRPGVRLPASAPAR